MTLSSKHHRCHAGASITKASAYCCAMMRQVRQNWSQQQKTGAGFQA
ncbi:MAG: hypothetical protein QM760_11150 [Nibricoccus sp.]